MELDREDVFQYHLTLTAEDGAGTLGNPNRASTIIVINVLDVNDNPPTFNPATYVVTLMENIDYNNFLTVAVSIFQSFNLFLCDH